MLVLSRKVNENIVIDGRIIVKVVRVDGGMVKLGISAPSDVPVHRQEVYDEIQRKHQQAVTSGRQPVPRIPATVPQLNRPRIKCAALRPPKFIPPK
jgi:carbon storage regulator